MGVLQPFRSLNPAQRRAFTACFLGWTLDAFDFFLLTFCLDSIAATFHLSLETAAKSIFWTLLMRPVGALVFGALAERFGRVCEQFGARTAVSLGAERWTYDELRVMAARVGRKWMTVARSPVAPLAPNARRCRV